MTVSYLSFRVPYSANRDCVIIIKPESEAYQAVCLDAATRRTIGSPSVRRDSNGARPQVSAADIIGMIGSYRLASAAVDFEADELADRSRRISSRLRSRRRL
jgi:hypothetical protein